MVTATSSEIVLYPVHCLSCRVVARLRASTAVDDCGLELQLDLSGAATSGLELLDDVHAGFICNLSKDNMLAIEPGGDDRSDEELGAITARNVISKELSAEEERGDQR
jgi:hypothetical protein